MPGLSRDGHLLGDAAPPQRIGRDRSLRALRPHPGAELKKTLRIFSDGASRGNPGPAGLGVVIEDDQGMRLRGLHRWLGVTTNNEAEYHALIEGLKAAAEWKPDRLELYLDSKLVVEQVSGRYKIKKPALQALCRKAIELKNSFDEVTVTHVEREKNKGADALANMAIDEHVKKAKSSG
ncbi:MAG: ribonuclease HI family protein [Candidatus Dormiibacterota bacterium]